jgi:hypothetical protein
MTNDVCHIVRAPCSSQSLGTSPGSNSSHEGLSHGYDLVAEFGVPQKQNKLKRLMEKRCGG